MKKVPHVLSIAVSLLIVAGAPAPNFAQTTSASSTPATNISNDYSYFLSNVKSQQVVNDLRNGQWTTTTIDPNTKLTTTTTEPLPTGKMGFGNVKISLALAQESLRQQGILQPTSEQLHTALVGGQMVPGDPTTTTNGILQMRAEGMGWGQIAQKYDVKLGQLMSGKQPASTTTTSTTSTSTTNKGIRLPVESRRLRSRATGMARPFPEANPREAELSAPPVKPPAHLLISQVKAAAAL
jgi:hypothetical protein